MIRLSVFLVTSGIKALFSTTLMLISTTYMIISAGMPKKAKHTISELIKGSPPIPIAQFF